MSTNWEQEIAELEAQRKVIEKEIDRLYKEKNALGLRAQALRNHELQRDYGIAYGDELAITPEFVSELEGRAGWSDWDVRNFTSAPYATVEAFYNGRYVSVKQGKGTWETGNVPVDMAKRMRKAWLEKQEAQ